jgi:hypothetical protein
MGQVAQGVEQGPERILPLGRVFAHQAQIGGYKAPFFVFYIAGVGSYGGHTPNFGTSA